MSAFLRKYGTGTGADIIIPMIKRDSVDQALGADWTPAAGDVKVVIDGVLLGNIDTLPTAVAMGNGAGWKFVFINAELQGKSIAVCISDSATKVVEDQFFIIETYGHASAMYKPDFSDSVRLGLTALPNAAADAAGGLPVSDAGGLDLDTQLGKLVGTIAAGTHQPQTGDSYPIVSSGTHGNAALKTDLDKVPKSDGTVAFNTTAINGIQSGLATSANVTSILNAITGLNNLSALANLYGPPLLEIPDSGDPDAVYAFTLVVRDNEGKLVALDGSPTIAAANAAGTDRSTNLSAVSNPATGRYTFTYSVADDATPESLRITCIGTVSAGARYIEWVGAVVDYDTLTTLLAVKAKTDNLPADPASTSDVTGARDSVLTRLGTPADTDLATDIAAVKTDTGNLVARITSTLFAGITSLAQWLGAMAGKQTPNSTAQTEMRATGAGSGTYDATTDSDEARAEAIAATKAKTDQLTFTTPNVVDANAPLTEQNITDIVDGVQTGLAIPTVEQIDQELSANHGAGSWEGGSGGAGAGARTVTFTVDDGTNPLQNAVVRVIQGAENYTSTTDANGEAVFALDDATWAWAVTKPGYDGETGALIVNGTEALTVSLDAVVVTPPTSPSLSAIEVLCLDSAGQIEVGVDVDIRMVSIPSGSQNIAFKGAKQTATSDADGIARFEVVQGSTCEWKRGAADVWQRISVDADGVTNVASVIGSP